MQRTVTQVGVFPDISANPAAFMLNAFRVPATGVVPMLPWLGTVAQRMEPVNRAAARVQLETLSLCSQQVRTALDYSDRLKSCRNPQDFIAAGFQFWMAAGQQHMEGSRRVMNAWASAWHRTDETPSPAEAAKARDFISVPEPDQSAEDLPRKPAALRVAAA